MWGNDSIQEIKALFGRMNVFFMITAMSQVVVKDMTVAGIQLEFRGADLMIVISRFQNDLELLNCEESKIHPKQGQCGNAFQKTNRMYFTFHRHKDITKTTMLYNCCMADYKMSLRLNELRRMQQPSVF